MNDEGARPASGERGDDLQNGIAVEYAHAAFSVLRQARWSRMPHLEKAPLRFRECTSGGAAFDYSDSAAPSAATRTSSGRLIAPTYTRSDVFVRLAVRAVFHAADEDVGAAAAI
jgi:hypothetical protein